MRIVLLTQDEPFYLAENLRFLMENMPSHSQIVGCVLFTVSPFGKRETMFQKMKRTYDIFGTLFTARYGYLYLINKFNPNKAVRKVLNDFQIPIIEMTNSVNSKESLALIKNYNPDLLISIAGNQVFKRPLIDLTPKGCLNLHTALLPKYRGLMPTFWALKNGEKYCGVSVFFVDEGIDSGPILVQEKVEIGNKTLEELIKSTKHVGMQAIINAIELIHNSNYQLIENDSSQQTYFHFPTRKDVKEFLKSGKRFFKGLELV